jgi:hypothetical protein
VRRRAFTGVRRAADGHGIQRRETIHELIDNQGAPFSKEAIRSKWIYLLCRLRRESARRSPAGPAFGRTARIIVRIFGSFPALDGRWSQTNIVGKFLAAGAFRSR